VPVRAKLTRHPAHSTISSLIELRKHIQEPFRDADHWTRASRIADELHAHLNTEEALRRIHAANQPRQSSGAVQETFLEFARQLGFESEKKGLFARDDLALRPDYFLQLDDTGIILEVERGKTTINNMDLLDFWKCHLCPEAHYLFLVVPKALRQNESMSPRNEFATVDRRLAYFFKPDNYTNVRALCLFGY
jgi:hypothetical protein